MTPIQLYKKLQELFPCLELGGSCKLHAAGLLDRSPKDLDIVVNPENSFTEFAYKLSHVSKPKEAYVYETIDGNNTPVRHLRFNLSEIDVCVFIVDSGKVTLQDIIKAKQVYAKNKSKSGKKHHDDLIAIDKTLRNRFYLKEKYVQLGELEKNFKILPENITKKSDDKKDNSLPF